MGDIYFISEKEKNNLGDMSINKIIGWIFIFLGIVIILYTVFSSFNIFTGNKEAPEIFSISLEQISKRHEKDIDLNQDIEKQAENQAKEIIKEQLSEMIPSGSFSKTFNLISWSIFSGILIFAGSKISEIGVKLVKK